jgi:hypothetical protein
MKQKFKPTSGADIYSGGRSMMDRRRVLEAG